MTEAVNNSAPVQNLGSESSQKFAYQQAMINLQTILGELTGVTEPTPSQESELSNAINAAHDAFEVLTEDGNRSDELYARTAAVTNVWGQFGIMNIPIDGSSADGTLNGNASMGTSGYDGLGTLISYLNEESTGGVDLGTLIGDINNATPKN